MKTKNILTILFIILIFGSCSTIRTAYDYDKDVDFSKYKTFAFFKEGMDKTKINDIDKKRFVNSITENLNQKGLTLDTVNPDVLVNVVVKGKDKVSVTDNYSVGYGWWYPGPALTMRQYTESTIYIDIIDKSMNQLVWQGKGTDEFNEQESNRDARINEAVSKILAQYPYGKQK